MNLYELKGGKGVLSKLRSEKSAKWFCMNLREGNIFKTDEKWEQCQMNLYELKKGKGEQGHSFEEERFALTRRRLKGSADFLKFQKIDFKHFEMFRIVKFQF